MHSVTLELSCGFGSVVIGSFLVAGVAGAQSPAEHIALGDSIYAQFKPDEALPHYLAAIGADSSNYEALWKAARSEIDLAEAEQGRRRGAIDSPRPARRSRDARFA